MDNDFTKDLKADIEKRLTHLGYTTFDDKTRWMIDFAISKIENHIKTVANIELIPAALYEIEIDQICGTFLSDMKATKQLTNYDFDQIVKQVQVGDTSTTFMDAQSPEVIFDRFVSKLIVTGESDIVKFRKLVW